MDIAAGDSSLDQAAEIVFRGGIGSLHETFKILLRHQEEGTQSSWLSDPPPPPSAPAMIKAMPDYCEEFDVYS